MKPALTLLALALVFYGGLMAGTALTTRDRMEASTRTAELHGVRDAYTQVECAVALVAAERWREMALEVTEAKVGRTGTLTGGGVDASTNAEVHGRRGRCPHHPASRWQGGDDSSPANGAARGVEAGDGDV